MYLRFAYVSTGIGVCPVAKPVVLYACVSHREGSRGRPYVSNVDHSVKRCNINVILPTKITKWITFVFCYRVVRIGVSTRAEKVAGRHARIERGSDRN